MTNQINEKGQFVKGMTPWNKGKKLHYQVWNKGKKASEELRQKLSVAHLGQEAWNKGKKWSEESKRKMSLAHIGIQSGKNHPNWKGGITPENHKIRTSLEMKLWRKKGKEKDGYRCVWCGERSRILHSDHIYSFAKYPRLRLSPENHQTLCVPCHKIKTKGDKIGIYEYA